jgi:serine protease AprX
LCHGFSSCFCSCFSRYTLPRLLSFLSLKWLLLAGALAATGPDALALPGLAPEPGQYWVVLRDKAGQKFVPTAYFSRQAQARRQRQHLPAYDSTDFPVRPEYVASVRAGVESVVFVSRWFNAVACRATAEQAAQLRGLPGVRSVEALSVAPLLPAARTAGIAGGSMQLSAADRQLARRQTESLGRKDFQRARLTGQGVRIAIFDVGFNSVDRHVAFAHLRHRKAIVGTYDFLKNTPNVYQGGSHGTEVLSCIAGQLPDSTFLGLAPGAEFLLARTEQMYRERYAEEVAWLAAAEWADRNGADIINSSLGYTTRRYFPEQMNGRTSLVARAAELAVRKGILVVNAAGNDGDDAQWRTVGTPADGDSVLAVGGIDPDTYLHIDFSSYGPTADKRLKPNVSAFGTVLVAAPGGYVRTQGTSFSSPLLAGFAACVLQQQRNLPVMELFRKMQQAGNLYPYFDYAHGYGQPRASFFTQPARPMAPTFDFVRQDSAVAVIIRPEAAYVPARTLPLYADSAVVLTPDAGKPPVGKLGQEASQQVPAAAVAVAAEAAPAASETPEYLYWQIMDAAGVLRRYQVLEVSQRAVLRVPLQRLQPGDVLRVHYCGFTQVYPAL